MVVDARGSGRGFVVRVLEGFRDLVSLYRDPWSWWEGGGILGGGIGDVDGIAFDGEEPVFEEGSLGGGVAVNATVVVFEWWEDLRATSFSDARHVPNVVGFLRLEKLLMRPGAFGLADGLTERLRCEFVVAADA